MKLSKKQGIQVTNRKRTRPSDAGRIEKALDELSEIGYRALSGETLTNPNFIARSRHPDLVVKIQGEKVPIELDGGTHGFGDDLTESQQTRYRNDDYVRAGYLPIIVNEEWLKVKNINQHVYLQCVLFNFEQQLRSLKRLKQK